MISPYNSDFLNIYRKPLPERCLFCDDFFFLYPNFYLKNCPSCEIKGKDDLENTFIIYFSKIERK